ncbi:MAG: glycosyltransferase, partial [Acidimicrobiia bacterium]
MRILQIHNRYRLRGGEDTVVEQEAELLRAAGHQVAQLQVENPEEAIPAARALMRAPWNGAAARRAAEAAASARPDLAHVHNTWFSLSPAIFPALQESGLPVVATLHNYKLLCASGDFFRDGAVCHDCAGGVPVSALVHRCY